MIQVIRTPMQLKFSELIQLYSQSIDESAVKNLNGKDRNAARLLAEQDLFDYFNRCFFCQKGARLYIWQDNGASVSAVRAEPFGDGVLLTGLETPPPRRREGYAQKILEAVLDRYGCAVYSHVHLDNDASLRLHLKCGFTVIKQSANLLNGSHSTNHLTLAANGRGSHNNMDISVK